MKRILVCICIVILLAAMPVLAQDTTFTSDEQESIDLVLDTLTTMQTLDSYSVNTEQNISEQLAITVGKETVTFTADITQISFFRTRKTADSYDAVGTLDQSTNAEIAGQTTSIDLSLKMVMLDGDLYIRMTSDDNAIADTLPEGWINLSEDSSATSNPVLATFNAESFARLYNLSGQLDEAGVISIETLDSTEIDGQPMQVFQIEYDPQALIGDGLFEALVESFAGSNSQFTSEEIEQIIQDMFEGAQIFFTLSIGDDGFLHQMDVTMTIDTTITIQDFDVPLTMQMETTSNFSDFNSPITIKAPEVGT